MRVAIWKTGHEIADTVAEALGEGIPDAETFHTAAGYKRADTHIGYGILRGMEAIYARSTEESVPCFLLDRGYFSPGHFDGYYRISHRGTQALWDESAPSIPYKGALERITEGNSHILVCPPTDYVCAFYGVFKGQWQAWAWEQAARFREQQGIADEIIFRPKGCPIPLEEHFQGCAAVITFNSSVGWEAVRRGIPCLSDVLHSTVGSFYGETEIKSLFDKFYCKDERLRLFDFMRGHQFTLDEIRHGNAWPLIKHYLQRYTSGMMAGRPSPQASSFTRYFAGQKHV